ncbi:MAG: hypothetical protein HY879_05765 [Deltaproteobacteria bacterium]|nr:hypothetical protein [Deltaproteobacteria bacterium]
MTIAAAGSTTAGSTGILDKNTFLQLFTTQLRNQDPLNPMDATAFTAQLAQFSSLEQLYNVNTNLNNLVTSQNSIQNGMLVNLIGKTVTLQDGSSGKVKEISINGTSTTLTLDTNKTVLFTDITKIS